MRLRRFAGSNEPRLGTLFLNFGGPGVSGVEFLGCFDRDGLSQYDIVGWDPPGVGESTPGSRDLNLLTNTSTPIRAPTAGPSWDALSKPATAFGTSCLRRSGALLAHVSAEDPCGTSICSGLWWGREAELPWAVLRHGPRFPLRQHASGAGRADGAGRRRGLRQHRRPEYRGRNSDWTSPAHSGRLSPRAIAPSAPSCPRSWSSAPTVTRSHRRRGPRSWPSS